MSEALDVVSKMLSCYPERVAGAAARGYLGALAAILVTYPACLARLSADPIRGVPRETKFLPTPCDVITWCERELKDLRKPVDTEDRSYAIAGDMISLREAVKRVEDQRSSRPTIEEMKAHYGEHWGIAQPPRKAAKPYKSLTDDELRAMYGPRHDETQA